MTVPGLLLGAPGVYPVPAREQALLRPERLDVAGFVGVAPRGPLDVPVAIESWSQYRWQFGGFEGPGLLPWAVHAFFAQGGARATVLRVSPLPRLSPESACGTAVRPGPRARVPVLLGAVDQDWRPVPGVRRVDLVAADEGTWGSRLTVRWDFEAQNRFTSVLRGTLLELPDGVRPPPLSLIRLRGGRLPVSGALAWTGAVVEREESPGRRRPYCPVEGLAGRVAPGSPLEVVVVTATVTVTDPDPTLRREEVIRGLGLRRGHCQFVGTRLAAESRLVRVGPEWPDAVQPPGALLGSVDSLPAEGGRDRYPGIDDDSFAGSTPSELLPVGGPEGLEEGLAAYGMDRMALVQELGMLAVPDLFWDYAPTDTQVEPAPRRRSPRFEPCRPDPGPDRYPGGGHAVLLDARSGAGAARIAARQRRLVALAERQRRFVALLDVPRHLPARAVARWRARFDSSYAAAYHPWLGVVGPDDAEQRTTPVPPSAFAAGVVAAREIRLGLPWGPANELAFDAVTVLEPISDTDHDALHLLGIDVFRAERDGFRLTAARTLSTDPDYRQLSVRRLMTMLRLVIDRQLQWTVFEPHTDGLRESVRGALTQLLRQLFRDGAFAGTTEDEAFFVRCDEALNPPASTALGRLVAEVGVAPAQPLEYVVLRISRDAEGTLGVER